MKKLFLVPVVLAFIACGEPAADKTENNTVKQDSVKKIKEENITLRTDTTTLLAYVAYDEASSLKRPAVIVVPEWWGLNEYPKQRAKQLAELGYVAIAVDFYGNGKIAANPEEANKLAGPFYQQPLMAKARIAAAIARLKEYSQVDTSKIAAIGYCFGGSMVLNAAKLGENLKGVVSFHGGLEGVTPQKGLTKADILVCHGEADSFVPGAQVEQFKKQLDSVAAPYTFKSYPNATHAFTNPGADENAKKFGMPIAYNAAADTASWNDMKTFFSKIFN
jgi:dienelactone hydrolase